MYKNDEEHLARKKIMFCKFHEIYRLQVRKYWFP